MRYFLFPALFLVPFWVQAQTTQTLFLSGTDKDNRVDWAFRIDKGMRAGAWTTIPVPSNWELEGFGVYNYGRGQNPPSDETGRYRHTFTVPQDWEGQVVRIVFEGSMTDTEVFINGRSAGPVHQGSFYRFSYDISDLLNYGGENLLEATVRNWSANESVNAAERRADFWIFGGIFRPVYLQAFPAEHIRRTAIDARADGRFRLISFLEGLTTADRLEAQIRTLEGDPVGEAFQTGLSPGADSAVLQTRVDEHQLWSPEFPNRYRVEVRLLRGQEILHRLTETFGFRTVTLRPRDGIYVNGQRIVFKGVNRHSSWPESGRTTSRALSVQDVQLMKDMNMNAVRMSHYSPDKHFLEATDSLGLFVIDELTGWQDSYDTEVGEKLVRELVTDDVNHPSVILWANGNEGGFNLELDDDFHAYDPQRRPVIHPWATFRGTDTHHYIDYNCCAGAAFHSPEIFFPTEFLHGLYDGGHGAGLEDFWRLMGQNPRAAGGFLWVFADEGIRRADQDGAIDTWGSNAPDGIVGPYREKEGSFYTIREIWSPVVLDPPTPDQPFPGRLRLENRYHFTNLDQTTFRGSWLRYPGPEDPAGTDTLAAFEQAGPNLPPGETGWLTIAPPEEADRAHALAVEVRDPHGREVFTYVFPLRGPAGIQEDWIPEGAVDAAVEEIDGRIWLRGSDLEVGIDRESGTIAALSAQGRRLSFDGGPSLDPVVGQCSLDHVTVYQEDGHTSVRFHFTPKEGENVRGTEFNVAYRLLPGGWLRMDYDYLPPGGTYPLLGVNFRYPEEMVNGIRWLGRGPYRVWKNRMKGPQLGVWEKDYNNTVTGEKEWVYPEFKGYHADLHWAVLDTDEMPFALATTTPGLFLRLYTPPPPAGAYNDNTDGVFPEGDLSILHGISPIGTKFKSADRIGPMGEAHQVNPFRDKVRFSARLYLKPMPTSDRR